MPINRRFVLKQQLFVRPVCNRHDVDVAKLRTSLAPITVGQDMMAADFATRFYFAAGRHGPMKQTVESCDAETAGGWFDVLKKGGEAANHAASIQ